MDLRDAKQPVIVIHEAPTHHAALRHDLISVSNMAEASASGETKKTKKKEEQEKKKRDSGEFFGRGRCLLTIYSTRSFSFKPRLSMYPRLPCVYAKI